MRDHRKSYIVNFGLLLLLQLAPVAVGRSPQVQSFSAKPDQPGNSCHGGPLVITRATLWTAEGLIENSE